MRLKNVNNYNNNSLSIIDFRQFGKSFDLTYLRAEIKDD